MSKMRPKSFRQLGYYLLALACFVQAGRTFLEPHTAAHAAIPPAPRYVEVPIEEVQAGDKVVSRNDQTGEFPTHGRNEEQVTSQPVAQAFTRIADHLRLVETESLVTGERQVIETTNEHPFWVTGQGWVDAGDLQPGNSLEDVTGQGLVVIATDYQSHPEGVPVFNFEVTNTHTDFVKAPTARHMMMGLRTSFLGIRGRRTHFLRGHFITCW